MVKRSNLANINLVSDNVKPRTHMEMCSHFDNNTEKDVSIESVPNFFWKLP